MVTGGNSGIGLAAARLFVAEGAHVVITGRNQKTLRAAAARSKLDIFKSCDALEGGSCSSN